MAPCAGAGVSASVAGASVPGAAGVADTFAPVVVAPRASAGSAVSSAGGSAYATPEPVEASYGPVVAGPAGVSQWPEPARGLLSS